MCAHELTSSETNPIRKMDFLVLTETEFFRQIDNEAEGRELRTAYNKFINEVLVFYASASSDGRRLFSTLVYTEIELYCLHEKLSPLHDDRAYHSRKALSFVRRILKHVSTKCHHYPPRKLIRNRQVLSVGRVALLNWSK